VKDLDAVSFARAYKQALEAKKHGKPIFLPQHLWDELPKRLHQYLTTEGDGADV